MEQLPPSKRPSPLRLPLKSSPFLPPSNWSFDDLHSHNPSLPLPHPRVVISPASGYGSASYSNLEEPMRQYVSLQSSEEAEAAPRSFPERPNEPDCAFYIRTGQCAYGMDCKFNHPPNRNLVVALGRFRGEYPERIGNPDCQYYMKTGTCKYGATCKFNHPKDSLGKVSTNVLGFPLRQGEKDCPYYMRTASCKFGATCKFNHPQPVALRAVMPVSGSPPGAPSSHTFPTGIPSWSLPRAQYMPRSRFQSPSNFTPVIVQPQNIVPVPGWGPYQAQLGTLASLDIQQPTVGGASLVFGTPPSNETSSGTIRTTYGAYVPNSATMVIPSSMHSSVTSKETVLPERPGQQNCQYYMKTGDCKYGVSCRFNHPKERGSAMPNCLLSPIGLPLRQGAPQCAFYMQYRTCKYGATCKFDHPMHNLPSASSQTELPITPYTVGMTIATYLPNSNSGSKIIHTKIVSNGNIDNQVHDDSFGGSNGNGNNSTLSGLPNADSFEMGGHERTEVAATLTASS